MNTDNFFSVERLVEFGLGMGIARRAARDGRIAARPPQGDGLAEDLGAQIWPAASPMMMTAGGTGAAIIARRGAVARRPRRPPEEDIDLVLVRGHEPVEQIARQSHHPEEFARILRPVIVPPPPKFGHEHDELRRGSIPRRER